MEILYVPIGVPTFDLEEAERQFTASAAMLKKLSPDVIVPDHMLLSIESRSGFLASRCPDLVIVQNITFANSEYASEIVSQTNCPILLWTLREDAGVGGRLRLNSLTGAFSAANVFHALARHSFEYVIGSSEENDVRHKIKACIDAVRVKKELTRLTIASIGNSPPGFGFGRALDAEIRKAFNVKLISIEARELMSRAATYTEEDIAEFRQEIAACIGAENLPAENIEKHLRLRKAYADFIRENRVGALASRCWPDFFTEYKTPVCAVLSMLNDAGIPAACEADIYGALSMFVASKLCGMPVFFGDPVAVNEENNTIIYWHCGMAPTKLSVQPKLGVHPNRKIGPVMDFCCKAFPEATVIRIGRKPNADFRMYIAKGEVIALPKGFQGTSIAFKPQNSVKRLVEETILAGWEPHYIVAPADIAESCVYLAHFLEIEICRF